jgi:ribosome-associated protein
LKGKKKMIFINEAISLNPSEIKVTFIASPGPGGQNVNKVATAVLLRFNVIHSPSLPESVRIQLITLLGKKITKHGELIIKSNRFRTQERNKQDALYRLTSIIKRAAIPIKKRKKTKLSLAVKRRRLDSKKLQSKKKALRRE